MAEKPGSGCAVIVPGQVAHRKSKHDTDLTDQYGSDGHSGENCAAKFSVSSMKSVQKGVREIRVVFCCCLTMRMESKLAEIRRVPAAARKDRRTTGTRRPAAGAIAQIVRRRSSSVEFLPTGTRGS